MFLSLTHPVVPYDSEMSFFYFEPFTLSRVLILKMTQAVSLPLVIRNGVSKMSSASLR